MRNKISIGLMTCLLPLGSKASLRAESSVSYLNETPVVEVAPNSVITQRLQQLFPLREKAAGRAPDFTLYEFRQFRDERSGLAQFQPHCEIEKKTKNISVMTWHQMREDGRLIKKVDC
ncbi:hypothetical protein [Vibrio gallicus]|uniref:hypothetical protein n=1 Tax=Vibrio gallicus TaxID=190897 RepID=UPI0021C2DD1A|nr:hypothetical protein [Vibrio gallicus]